MVQHIIGIVLIVFAIAIFIFVDKKERYCSGRFEITIFNRWQIPSGLFFIPIVIILATGLSLLIS